MSKEDVQEILKKKGLPCQAEKDFVGATDLEASLADHTDIDNMDEDNKFICKKCSEKGCVIMHVYVAKYSMCIAIAIFAKFSPLAFPRPVLQYCIIFIFYIYCIFDV